MELIQFLGVCCAFLTLTSSTYVHQRPIAFSKLDRNSESSYVDRKEQSASVNKEPNREIQAAPSIFLPGFPLYSPVLTPVKVEEGGHGNNGHNSANGGAFGASGSLIIPGLNLNLGAGNIFGGSLSASGGFSGFFGPNHGHGHGGGGGHAAIITPIHYGYPIHHRYPVHQLIGGAGGFSVAGAHQGIVPFYAGSRGTYHKTSEGPASAPVVTNFTPNGPFVQGVPLSGQSEIYQDKQPDIVLDVSPYQLGENFEQANLPSGFHHPGFISSSAGRLGYPVLMASPEQLQDISFRQNPNPFTQFFQRPFQALQMFIRPTQNNSSKQPEKPETEKPVVESPSAGRPSTDKPVVVKPNSENPSSQSHGAAPPVKVQGKQNVTAPAVNQKLPTGNVASVTVSVDKKDKKEKPKPSSSAPPAVSDVVASVNEVIKSTAAINAGSAPILPVFIEEADAKSRVGDDLKSALEDTTDANVNAVPNDESPLDIESKPIA